MSDLDRQIMDDPRHPASSALKMALKRTVELAAALERVVELEDELAAETAWRREEMHKGVAAEVELQSARRVLQQIADGGSCYFCTDLANGYLGPPGKEDA